MDFRELAFVSRLFHIARKNERFRGGPRFAILPTVPNQLPPPLPPHSCLSRCRPARPRFGQTRKTKAIDEARERLLTVLGHEAAVAERRREEEEVGKCFSARGGGGGLRCNNIDMMVDAYVGRLLVDQVWINLVAIFFCAKAVFRTDYCVCARHTRFLCVCS